MTSQRLFANQITDLPAAERKAVTKHALVVIEAQRVIATLKWLIPIGEAAFVAAKPNHLSGTDYDLVLRDAIEIAYAELRWLQADPYYACWAGHDAVLRLACAASNLVGHPPLWEYDVEALWELARAVLR